MLLYVDPIERDLRPVHAPAFELLKEGDTPLLSDQVFARDRGGFLPELEILGIDDPRPRSAKRDYLPAVAAVLILAFVAVAVRVVTYYATRHSLVDPRPLADQAQATPVTSPAVNPTAIDDTIYFADTDVTLPVLISKSEPQGGTPGKVVLLMLIDPEGKAHYARVWHGLDPDHNVKAILAAEKWRFRPATKNGKPVPVVAQFEINFQ